jgi:hypothetical protein
MPVMDPAMLLRTAADKIYDLASRSTGGDWRFGGLLASRPEVIAHRVDGSTEHVAEARSGSADWIVTLSPAVAGPLVAWLRAAASEPTPEAMALARTLLDRLR